MASELEYWIVFRNPKTGKLDASRRFKTKKAAGKAILDVAREFHDKANVQVLHGRPSENAMEVVEMVAKEIQNDATTCGAKKDHRICTFPAGHREPLHSFAAFYACDYCHKEVRTPAKLQLDTGTSTSSTSAALSDHATDCVWAKQFRIKPARMIGDRAVALHTHAEDLLAALKAIESLAGMHDGCGGIAEQCSRCEIGAISRAAIIKVEGS